MDFVGLIVLVIIKILPQRVAMPLIAGVLLLIGWGAFAWRGSLETSIGFCNSAEGRLSQVFNGAQTTDCGVDSLLALVALGVGVVSLVLAIIPAGVWIYQLTHPGWDLKKFADDLV